MQNEQLADREQNIRSHSVPGWLRFNGELQLCSGWIHMLKYASCWGIMLLKCSQVTPPAYFRSQLSVRVCQPKTSSVCVWSSILVENVAFFWKLFSILMDDGEVGLCCRHHLRSFYRCFDASSSPVKTWESFVLCMNSKWPHTLCCEGQNYQF